MSLLSASLAYASRLSLHVFPLYPRSKEPNGRLVHNGFLNATTDRGIIENWWRRDMSANIGVACAPSGVVVIDVDPRNGGDDTLPALEKELGSLPVTWTCLTPSGGQHRYFRDSVGHYVGTLGDGIDIKFHGYVVAPPSIHPDGGTYAWDLGSHPLDVDMAHLPDAWLDRMTQRRRTSLSPTSTDARESLLGAAFELLNALGDPMHDGRRMVRCPWLNEHSDGRGDGKDSSTVLFPRAKGRVMGGFRCAHSHCSHRGWRDVLRDIPPRIRLEASAACSRAGLYDIADSESPTMVTAS
jgi:Bifunctional DNA primase/polymerase, N-terminal